MVASTLTPQNGSVPLPTVQSLNFRNQLASLVSPLRRVRPRIPFYRLAAHRIPTLWGLYRSLLQTAPTENWLETFKLAQSGDTKTQALLQRYDRFLQMKAEKEHWKQLVRNEVEWRERLRNRPILTGAFPRMKPQPVAISRIIANRLKQKERRFVKLEELNEMKDLIRREQHLERNLVRATGAAFEPVFDGEPEWSHNKSGIYVQYRTNFSNKYLMHAEIKSRTKRKNENENVAERKAKEEKSLSFSGVLAQVGYVGLLKKRKGWKLKEPKTEIEGKRWSVEDAEWIGKEERAAAAKALLELQEANAKKRL
ncbi:hypothetical protein BT96DRAFT_970239 [Gymnopus androsaceus JB14]|uniref:Uncharacterized protein n=1 Tax=Gymnopus androsaceus JB14 TaxID=1447944 RepID=A0A6A4IK30_9AGAR|nr:hypothetical protein BT96DRAFT_970239 [Gymnopus androsaceus JB14]